MPGSFLLTVSFSALKPCVFTDGGEGFLLHSQGLATRRLHLDAPHIPGSRAFQFTFHFCAHFRKLPPGFCAGPGDVGPNKAEGFLPSYGGSPKAIFFIY